MFYNVKHYYRYVESIFRSKFREKTMSCPYKVPLAPLPKYKIPILSFAFLNLRGKLIFQSNFIMTSYNYDSTVHKTWNIESSENRYLMVTQKSYSSSPIHYLETALWKKNYVSNLWNPTKRITLRLSEVEMLPFESILQNNLAGGLIPDLPDNEKDCAFFDKVVDFQELTVNNRRTIRVGVKKFNNVSYVFLKIYLQRSNVWRRYQEINLTMAELSAFQERLRREIPNMTFGNPFLDDYMHETQLYSEQLPAN